MSSNVFITQNYEEKSFFSLKNDFQDFYAKIWIFHDR